MAEYIEREALRSAVKNKATTKYDWSEEIDFEDFEKVLDTIPAADVAPVVHGYWIPSESDFDDDDTLFDVEDWCDWQCSACHTDICYEDPMERRWLPKFCPHCGARMDGE